MITKLDNEADVFATLQALDLPPETRMPRLIAAAALLCPLDEDFEILIHRLLLSDSYRINPSMMARNAFMRLEFADYMTYTVNQHVGFKFLREAKPRYLVQPQDTMSMMARTRLWLDSDKEQPLEIPIAAIPHSIQQRPEQFVYSIKRLGYAIKITRFKSFYRITIKT